MLATPESVAALFAISTHVFVMTSFHVSLIYRTHVFVARVAISPYMRLKTGSLSAKPLMECSEPGAIRDEELAAYIAGGKVRPEVAQHLSHCQTCSSQVATYQRIDLQLTNKLLRWDCPSSQVLGEYQLGLLATTQINEVRSHLLYCLRCTAEVATLTEFLTNDPFLVERPVIQSTLAVRPATSNHRLPVQEALRSLDQWREQAVENARRVVAALVSPPPRFAVQ